MSQTQSFTQLLQQVKATTLSAYGHQDISFERLVNELNVPRDLSHTPLFQVMFILQNTAEAGAMEQGQSMQLGNLSLESAFDTQSLETTAKFDMTLTLVESSEGLSGEVEYRTSLFDDSTINTMMSHFEQLLTAIVEQPTRPIGELPMLSEGERQQLLIDWNQTQSDYDTSALVHERIEQQAIKTPDAIAVICGDEQLSYQALDTQANQLAHRLMVQGVSVGDRVGICLSRSASAMVAILATLKAGAAYVPMDISYPVNRLLHMANNADMRVVLTQAEHSETFSDQTVIRFSGTLSESQSLWQEQPKSKPSVSINSDNLLYLVYTSGSTGLPKGAGVTHRNEINLLTWYTREYQMQASDKALIISALGFDLTQKNLFALLSVGGTVVLNEQSLYDPEHIKGLIEQHQITLLNCAPSAFYPLQTSAADYPALASLRTVLFGGEPIKLDLMAGWITQTEHQCDIVNMYGPTECTDIAATYTMHQPSEYLNRAIPIGRPNSNISLYVLNEQLQPLPIGVAGELYIGGAGVGTGYFKQDDLTREVFLDNPFQNGKLYRTGDLVRYHADGNIEYLERIGQQVKIRGLRIELGEIEHILQQHSQVKEAVAVVDDQSILSYLVTTENGTLPSQSALRDYAKASLPDYMIPAHFIGIDKIPLSPNGKLDRKALPQPDLSAARQDYLAPETQVQQQLIEIWYSALNITPEERQIGISDNFFELGGQSLLAVKVIRDIENTFGVKLPITELFSAQTVQALSRLIERQQAPWSAINLMNPECQSDKTPLFMIHPIGGMTLCYHHLTQQLGNERVIYGVQARGFEENQTAFTNMEQMAAYYVEQIKAVRPNGPYYLAGQSFGGLIAFEVARQLRAQNDKVGLLSLIDTHQPTSMIKVAMKSDVQIMQLFITDIIGELNIPATLLKGLSRQELIDKVTEQTHNALSDDTLHSMFSVLEGFRQCQVDYKPTQIDIPIKLVRPQQELKGAKAKLKRLMKADLDGNLGWDNLTSKDLQVDIIDGSHYSVLRPPHVDELAQVLTQQLKQADNSQD